MTAFGVAPGSWVPYVTAAGGIIAGWAVPTPGTPLPKVIMSAAALVASMLAAFGIVSPDALGYVTGFAGLLMGTAHLPLNVSAKPAAAAAVLLLGILSSSSSACASGQAIRMAVDASNAAATVLNDAGTQIGALEKAAETAAVAGAKTQADGAAAVAAVRATWAAVDQAFAATQGMQGEVIAAVQALEAKAKAFVTSWQTLVSAGKTVGADLPSPADELKALAGAL